MQVQLLESEHDAVLSLFKSANPAFNKLAALLLYLTEQLRNIWSQVSWAFVSWQCSSLLLKTGLQSCDCWQRTASCT